jgi:RND family efflux transporter MFP subunit
MTQGRARTFLKIALPFVVLLAGVGALAALVLTKPEPARTEPKEKGVLVDVQQVHSGRHEIAVDAHGTVVAARKVRVQPQVSGQVRWQNDQLVPGGQLDEGEELLRIDQRDYRLAVENSRAQVSKAQVDLRLERGRKSVAEREWEMFAKDDEDQGNEGRRELALREPQVRAAKVALQSAKSALRRAQLDLKRTTLEAPFNALVLEENVDTGQVVGPQTTAATLVGTDRFWVRVAIPVDALPYIRIPGTGGHTKGAEVRIVHELGERPAERRGRVLRLLGDLDKAGSMARVLVSIDDPLGLEQGPDANPRLPILLGSYVRVHIEAEPLDNVLEVPRAALREGDQVYVMNDDQRLQIQDVEIAWRRKNSVLISGGLEDGARVIVSGVPSAANGMLLRPSNGEDGSPAVAEAQERPGSDEEAKP